MARACLSRKLYGGLKDEIRSKVKLFHPTILVHATSLARLQEDNMQQQRHGLI